MHQRVAPEWRVAAAAVILANALFVVIQLSVAHSPREVLIRKIKNAFVSGELIDKDVLPLDTHRGYNQYNDCLILQLITNRTGSGVADAFGPVWYLRQEEQPDVCSSLHQLTDRDGDTRGLIQQRYTRYWHGYNAVAALLLQHFELIDVRRILKTAFCIVFVAVGVAPLGNMRLTVVALPIAIFGLAFWQIGEFGQSLSHAPGEMSVFIGLFCLLVWRKHLISPAVYVPWFAAFGAVLAYLDMFTGPTPMAFGLLIPVFALIQITSGPAHGSCNAKDLWRTIAVAAAALFAGEFITVVTKQALAMSFVSAASAGSFTSRLGLYMGFPGVMNGEYVPPFVGGIRLVLREGASLTHESVRGARLLFAVSVVAWIAAAASAYLSRHRPALNEFAVFLAGAVVPLAWMVVLQNHTAHHSELMVRLLLVPIALGWGALGWQLLR